MEKINKRNTLCKLKKGFVCACFLVLVISCYANRKQDIRFSAQKLKQSYISKDEVQFLHQFPKNFKQFQKYFGWDFKLNQPEVLYDEAHEYIVYWFKLLNTNKYESHEKYIISICTVGYWEADANGYFQQNALKYIKEKQKYQLINNLSDEEAYSVFFFLFDGPHPQFDAEFESHLSPSKKKVFNELFLTGFYDNNENENVDEGEDENLLRIAGISHYVENDSYFIKDIDINNDAILDKIVSAEPYNGDELLLFVNNDNNYKLALKTTNFSEDGGHQIKDIQQTKEGFVIITHFPDRGFSESHHYISYANNRWVLTNTIYKTKSGLEEDAFIYVCDLKQGLDLTSDKLLENLKQIPADAKKEQFCSKIKME